MKRILTLFFIGVLPLFLFSQNQHICATDEVNREIAEQHPWIGQIQNELDAYTLQYIATHYGIKSGKRSEPLYIIPIVFHIIHNYGQENVTDDQIYDAVKKLNDDFRKRSSDTGTIAPIFQRLAADCEIEFRLPTVDPKGKCTNGIERIQSTMTYAGSDLAKFNPWPHDLYLNIWLVETLERGGGVLAYAFLPSSVDGLNALRDGVIGLYNAITGNSRTLAHEVGHSLNLRHVWGNTNEPGVACGDDGVFDTPLTDGAFNCDINDINCSTKSTGVAYHFDSVKVNSGTTDPSPLPVLEGLLAFGSFSANGVSSNSGAAGLFAYSGWGTGGTYVSGDVVKLTATTCSISQVGVDTVWLTNQSGCDSVVITTTTFSTQEVVHLATTSCDTLQVGIDTMTLTNQSGCDSLVITNTTFNAEDVVRLTATTCDALQAGIDTVWFINQSGCDSLVITTTTFSAADVVNLTASVCNTLQVRIDTMRLSNQSGCDSLVITSFLLTDLLYQNVTGSLDTLKYYEFTLAPDTGAIMTLTGISFRVKRSATGPRTYAVRSSVNNFGSNLSAAVTPANPDLSVQGGTVFFITKDITTEEIGSRVSLSGTMYVNRQTPVTFRIYAWNSENTGGTFGIDSLTVLGTAGIVENTQNIMNYSSCPKMFTEGQKQAMHAALNSDIGKRNQLWTENALTKTGTVNSTNENTCLPVADFVATSTSSGPSTSPARRVACVGTSLTFKDFSSNGPITAYAWTFANANTSTSSDQNPVVTFNQPGWQKVTLTVTNAYGQNTLEKENYIHVVSDAQSNTFAENFEDGSSFDSNWAIENYDNNVSSWKIYGNASYSGGQCLGLNTFDVDRYDMDVIYSPLFNMSGADSLEFKYSLSTRATTTANMEDRLKIYYSINCGQNWTLLGTRTGAQITNAGFFNTYFVPTSEEHWSKMSIKIPSQVINNGSAFFKFEFTAGNGYSNNFYLDDINVDGIYTSTGANLNSELALNIYPNPTDGIFTIWFNSAAASKGMIKIFDMAGKQVMLEQYNFKVGMNSTVIDRNLTDGMYYVVLLSDDKVLSKPVIIKSSK